MKISDVVHGKASQDVVTIDPAATVRELVALLAEHNVGALVVSEDGVTVLGIVSERDVVRRLHEDESVLDAAVADDDDPDGPSRGHASVSAIRVRQQPPVAD